MVPFIFRADPSKLAGAADLVVRVGRGISTREELFDRLQAGLRLPDYFGRNWDALDDLLRDLHWVDSKRVVILHEELPQLPEESLRTYLSVLARAVEDWQRGPQREIVVVFPESAELRVRGLLEAP